MTTFRNTPNRPEPRLLLIYTGGTIGMVEDPDTGVLKAFNFDSLKENMPELGRLGCRIDVSEYTPPIDSSLVDPHLWLNLVHTIRSSYDRYDGFVILHGTDTMAYTASALSFLLGRLTKPVILTGAQLPIGKLRTDGRENLIASVETAIARDETTGLPLVPEVCIYFNDKLLRGNRATKSSADHFDAFSSPNYPPLAHAGIEIDYQLPYIGYPTVADEPAHPVAQMDAHVGVLKLFPGITPEPVQSILSTPGLRGLVLETYGSGNAPSWEWFIRLLSEAAAHQILIVNVTQCAVGAVDMSRYETGNTLEQIGVINGHDMTCECALTKLMYLLAQPHLTTAQRARLMSLSLRGELTL